ncbi:MAG: hypothetical protein U0003_03785 [Vampirovibrionales bacterium]
MQAALLSAFSMWCLLVATQARSKTQVHQANRAAEKASLAKDESQQLIQQLTQKVATLETALKQATASSPPTATS